MKLAEKLRAGKYKIKKLIPKKELTRAQKIERYFEWEKSRFMRELEDQLTHKYEYMQKLTHLDFDVSPCELGFKVENPYTDHAWKIVIFEDSYLHKLWKWWHDEGFKVEPLSRQQYTDYDEPGAFCVRYRFRVHW